MSDSVNKQLTRLPFPGKVVRGPGALATLGDICQAQGKKLYILGGKTALAKTKQSIYASIAQTGLDIAAFAWYGGECSQENIDKLAEDVLSCKADVIVAVGGGKALDTGKAVGAKCNLPVVTVPTIAATCAAVTPLSVTYNNKGEFTGNLFLDDCPAGVIVDTSVILATPVSWLIAGLGDTLAKMYELRAAASLMPPNSEFALPPSSVRPTMTTTATSAMIRPYSTMPWPSSFFHSFIMSYYLHFYFSGLVALF